MFSTQSTARLWSRRDMPVWGEFFPMQALNAADRAQTESEVHARIQRLVDYLKSVFLGDQSLLGSNH